MQRFNTEDFKEQIFRKVTQFNRNRSKVVKCLGTYWFQEMSVEELYKQRDKLVRTETGIHNERQLASFMEKQQSIRDEFGNVQWRAFLIEDYSESESIFVYKVHHCVADGIGSILMCANLTDKPDVKTFPYMALRFAFWQRVLINLTVPFMIGFISV
jgi:hypothetical protein